ncbi:MAG: GGDEF domain-containing protein [Clostridia bacterium]|nr:GGDEF domain-containing protein [Clostridia bacterium]
MRLLLVLLTFLIILFLVIILKLLSKIQKLAEKNKYADEANMWHKLAITDVLTGVYNRNAYNLYINKDLKGKTKELRGIIIFDIDNFKIINDTKGHPAGDIVLKNVAKNILEVFSEPKHRVFRIGGDKFSVLTEGISEKEIIKRLIVLKKHLQMDGNISVSKGYSMIKDNYENAYKYADEMLYADKLSKKCEILK